MQRTLTITIRPDWQASVREAVATARIGLERGAYMGERLNFETPRAFFSRLTGNRWRMIETLQAAEGEIGVRELARRLGRDIKRVHEDAVTLAELGLIERNASGRLTCPYADIHVDMHVMRKAA
jgi:predicted transcriptional regulator